MCAISQNACVFINIDFCPQLDTIALHHIKMTFCKERYMKNNRMHGGSVRIMQASHKCKIMEEQCRLYLTEHS